MQTFTKSRNRTKKIYVPFNLNRSTTWIRKNQLKILCNEFFDFSQFVLYFALFSSPKSSLRAFFPLPIYDLFIWILVKSMKVKYWPLVVHRYFYFHKNYAQNSFGYSFLRCQVSKTLTWYFEFFHSKNSVTSSLSCNYDIN